MFSKQYNYPSNIYIYICVYIYIYIYTKDGGFGDVVGNELAIMGTKQIAMKHVLGHLATVVGTAPGAAPGTPQDAESLLSNWISTFKGRGAPAPGTPAAAALRAAASPGTPSGAGAASPGTPSLGSSGTMSRCRLGRAPPIRSSADLVTAASLGKNIDAIHDLWSKEAIDACVSSTKAGRDALSELKLAAKSALTKAQNAVASAKAAEDAAERASADGLKKKHHESRRSFRARLCSSSPAPGRRVYAKSRAATMAWTSIGQHQR